MKPSEVQFALNLQALASPQCRRIIEVLVKGHHNLNELSQACKLTLASTEKHLEILIGAGLVKMRMLNGEKRAILQKSKFDLTVDWFLKLTP